MGKSVSQELRHHGRVPRPSGSEENRVPGCPIDGNCRRVGGDQSLLSGHRRSISQLCFEEAAARPPGGARTVEGETGVAIGSADNPWRIQVLDFS